MRAGRDRGAVVSTLFPAVVAPYRRLGYELGGTFTKHRSRSRRSPRSRATFQPCSCTTSSATPLASERATDLRRETHGTGRADEGGPLDRPHPAAHDDESRRAVVVRGSRRGHWVPRHESPTWACSTSPSASGPRRSSRTPRRRSDRCSPTCAASVASASGSSGVARQTTRSACSSTTRHSRRPAPPGGCCGCSTCGPCSNNGDGHRSMPKPAFAVDDPMPSTTKAPGDCRFERARRR